MSGFEEYKKKQDNQDNRDLFVTNEINKGIDINKPSYDYDPEQLMEHLTAKISDKSEEAFALRTKYYFSDRDAQTAKIRRYQKLSNIGENKDKLTEYAGRYNYHKATDRQYAADTAAHKFMDVQNKQYEYRKDDDPNSTVDSLTKYKHRKEIMKYRMEALKSVAFVKAQNKKHEKYLIGRSRLSCNLVLKDQLEHFIELESNKQDNAVMLRKLRSELTKVESEIKKATKTLIDNVPQAQYKWREANGLNKAAYTRNMNIYRQHQNPGCDMNAAILMTELSVLQRQQSIFAWPKKSVLGLNEGTDMEPLSKAEKENLEWNKEYDKADDAGKLAMQRHALKRFMKMPLPSAEAIKGSKAGKYIIANIRDYYDLTKRALPYYKNLMNNPGNDPIGLEIQNDAKLRARINYIDAIDKYLDYRLRRDHQICFGEYGAEFESDPLYKYTKNARGRVTRQRKYGDDERGHSRSNEEFAALNDAFRAFKAAMAGQGQVQVQQPHVQEQNQAQVQIQNIQQQVQQPQAGAVLQEEEFELIIDEQHLDQPAPEEVVEVKQTVRNMVELFENKGKEDNKNVNKEENQNKINIIEEDKKEEKKENKLKDRINIFEKKEEKKEDKKEEIKEEKKEEKKQEDKKEDAFVVTKENGRTYRFSAEQEALYQAYHEKQPLITRRIFNLIVASRKIGEMKLNKKYIELFHNCSDDIRSLSDDKTGSTIDRDIQAMMKPVLFDEKGEPISEEDKKNHQWNTDWLNCWQKGKVDKAKAEKMLAEHMPHVFDEAEKLLAVVKKNADNPKKLQAAMENYFENVMNNERDLLSFFQMSQFGLSIDNLKRKIPSVKEFIDNNPKFNKLDDLVGQARNVLNMYVNFTYGMDMTRQGVDFVYEKDKLASKKKALAPSYEGVLMMLSMTYQEDKEALDKATDYSYGKSKKKEEIKQEEIIEEKKEEKNKKKAVKNENKISENKIIENKINENVINESFANPHFISDNMAGSYKRKNPDLSDKAVSILKAKRNMTAMITCPEYKKLMEKTGEELKGTIAKASIDRVAAYVMRPVIFDENYKPVNTKENIANHEWNIKWLKAWEDNAPLTEGDLKAKKAKETKKNISRIKLTKKELADMEKENKKRSQRRQENEKIRKQMIEEEASKMFEGFTLPPIPKSENLTGNELAEYRSELDKWIEEQMEKDPERYYLFKVKLTAMDNLAKQSKDLRRVYMKDSARMALDRFMAGLDSYVSFYLISKYHIEVAHKGEDAVLTPKEAETRGKNYEGMLEDMAKSVAMTAIPYKKALENKKLKLVDFNELRQAHEGNAIITDTHGELELKKEIAEDIKDKVNAVNTEKISLRRKVDIEDKKRLDFKTFEKLSAFGTLFENKNDLSKYCALYGLGLKKQNAKNKEDDGSKEIKEVMDKLTDVVWKFDLRDINLSSDEHLMLHAAELEKMSQAVEAYKDLLFANPEYLKKLKQDDAIDKKAFPDRAEEMIDHVVKLTAVTDYYRARKLVLTDELYTSKLNSQISYQSEKGHGIQMRRLKKMMRASYIAALNMNRAFGGKIPKELSVKAESEEEEAAIKNLFRDPVTVKEEKEERIRIEQERLKKEEEERKRKEKELEERRKKGEIIDEKKEAEKRKEEEKKKEEERKKKKDIHALDINVNIKDSLLEKLDALTVRDKELKRLENEKLFQAPLWMQNAFTLDSSKIPNALKTEDVKNPFFAIDNDKFATTRLNLYLEDPDVKSLDEKRVAAIKEITGVPKIGKEPKFKSKDDKLLEKLEVSDDWSRTQTNFAKEYMYGKCEEEMVELTELMKIQESKEWVDEKGVKHSKNWEDIEKDKEALAFYKSAYTELAMKLIFSIYATGKRVAETYAPKALILHPVDFLLQLTYQVRQNITTSAVISNVIGERKANVSGTKQERVKFLFDNNDDGTYNLDIEDMQNTTGVMTALGFKVNATTQGIMETATKQNIEDDENEDEVAAAEGKSKKLFGKKEFFKKVVKPEFEAYQKEHPPIEGMVDGLFYTHDDNFIMAWYLNRHPEYINKKALMSKYDGETVLETNFANAYISPFGSNEYDIAQCIKKKIIDVPSNEELDNYEKHLVKEKYSILRTQYDSLSSTRMNPKEKMKVVDENGTVIGEETNQLILDARKKDPYGINLFKTQFSELEYVDKGGKKHFRQGI